MRNILCSVAVIIVYSLFFSPFILKSERRFDKKEKKCLTAQKSDFVTGFFLSRYCEKFCHGADEFLDSKCVLALIFNVKKNSQELMDTAQSLLIIIISSLR